MIKLPTDDIAKENGCYYDPNIPATLKAWLEKHLPQKLLQWQEDIIDACFGWRDSRNDRRFTTCNIFVPKQVQPPSE